MKNSVAFSVSLFLVPALLLSPAGLRAAEFETPRVLKAKNLLPADLLRGQHYEVEPQVANDGFMNHYTVRSDFGTFEASSTAMIHVRISEIEGIARLMELSETDAFAAALAESAAGTVQSATRIVTDPRGTAEGIPEGVGRMFKRVARTADKVTDRTVEAVEKRGEGGSGDVVSSEEAVKAGKELAGVNKAKRQLAKRVRVDPYSRNEVLQAELERLSWAAFGGNLTMKAAKSVVPYIGYVTNVSNMVWDMNPADLEIMNRERLKELGATGEQIDAFYANPWYTPTAKTVIVNLMGSLQGVESRTAILDLAAAVGNLDEARLFLPSLKILTDYHSNVGAVGGITSGTRLPWGMTGDGIVIIPVAVDHMVWTAPMAETAKIAGDLIASDPSVKKVELRIAGTVSEHTGKELEILGWTVTERALKTGAIGK